MNKSNSGPELYLSSNSGKSWKSIGKFTRGSACEAITTDPSDPKKLFVGTVFWGEGAGGGIYYSPDNGATWKEIGQELPNNTGPAAMAVDPKSKMLYVLLYAGSVYKVPMESLN